MPHTNPLTWTRQAAKMSDADQVAFAMTFLDTIQRAKTYLEEQRRVSLSALKLEFDRDDARLESLIEELVDVQQLAAREGRVLSWIGAAPTEASAPETEARVTPEAERRHLTVLFCDLVGSTELASRLDPEDWRDIVRQYQQICSDAIERYEGHIAQYLGDGLLVYFGYPRAHENDAECAVWAGLGIVKAIRRHNPQIEARHGLELAVRIGIHTGLVVVGEIGAGDRRETLALGDTTNLAARLQGLAAPDTIVVSPETLRLVRGIFLTEDLGAQTLRGIAEPVVAHRVVRPSGVRSRLDIACGPPHALRGARAGVRLAGGPLGADPRGPGTHGLDLGRCGHREVPTRVASARARARRVALLARGPHLAARPVEPPPARDRLAVPDAPPLGRRHGRDEAPQDRTRDGPRRHWRGRRPAPRGPDRRAAVRHLPAAPDESRVPAREDIHPSSIKNESARSPKHETLRVCRGLQNSGVPMFCSIPKKSGADIWHNGTRWGGRGHALKGVPDDAVPVRPIAALRAAREFSGG